MRWYASTRNPGHGAAASPRHAAAAAVCPVTATSRQRRNAYVGHPTTAWSPHDDAVRDHREATVSVPTVAPRARAMNPPASESRREYGYHREPLQPVRAQRNESLTSLAPARARVGVFHHQDTVAHQRLDPCPLVRRCDLWSQVPPRLTGPRGSADRPSVQPRDVTPPCA